MVYKKNLLLIFSLFFAYNIKSSEVSDSDMYRLINHINKIICEGDKKLCLVFDLRVACREGNLEEVQSILNKIDNQDDRFYLIMMPDEKYQCAFFDAIKSGNIGVVEFLVSKFDMDQKFYQGENKKLVKPRDLGKTYAWDLYINSTDKELKEKYLSIRNYLDRVKYIS
jgi:hypothetical protein